MVRGPIGTPLKILFKLDELIDEMQETIFPSKNVVWFAAQKCSI